MRHTRIASLLACIAGISFAVMLPPQISGAAGQSRPAAVGSAKYYTYKQLSRDRIEQFLLDARIVSEQPIEKGITHTFRVTMTDGYIYHDAHVQQIDLYRPEARTKNGIEKNFTDSYKYNIAAYRLDKMMDLNMVPPCVSREVNGKPSAVDWWVDDVQFDEQGRQEKNADPPDLNYWSKQLNDIRDFDQLIYNEDRNEGNLLIDKDWKVWAIDHSRSFRTNPTLRDPSVLRRISGKMLNALKSLREPAVEASLSPFISKEAVEALMTRRDLLVKFFENQITEKGPDVVLTDLPRHTEHVTVP